MRNIIVSILFLTAPTIVFATGGHIPNPIEKCGGIAKKMATSVVQEANTNSYEYGAINKEILLNDETSVSVSYDKYIYYVGKDNVASYLEVVLDTDCFFVEAERINDL